MSPALSEVSSTLGSPAFTCPPLKTPIDAAILMRHLGHWRTAPATGPVYHALADAIRLSILDGRLPLGAQLPSERTLAALLHVSRTTVTAAYGELRKSGHLHGRQGARSCTSLPLDQRTARKAPSSESASIAVDFATAAMSAPEGVIFDAYRDAVDSLYPHLDTIGFEQYGLLQLRETVAHEYSKRGLATSPDQIMITSGAQHALALLFATYVDPLDRVLIEHPTYLGLLETVRRHGAKPVPVSVRSVTNSEARHGVTAGWEIPAIEIALRQAAPNLAVLIIDNHNPTGLTMPVHERIALSEAILRSRTMTVIDESLVDMWHDAPSPPPFACFLEDKPELVITLGSMSKSYWGGLRVGWMRAEAEVIHRVAATRPSIDLGIPVVEQLATCSLLTKSEKILPQRRQLVRSRREYLEAELLRVLPDWEPTTGRGGLSMWVHLPRPMSSAVAAASARVGVTVVAGPRFGVGGAFERHLRLPHTQSEAVLTQGVMLLERAWRSVTGVPPASSSSNLMS